MIEIDGATHEGGGQILRVALALSCVLRKPARIFNIRAKRKNPGLQAQHLLGANILAKMTGARATGAQMHSTQLTFEPNEIRGGDYSFDVGTAGSISLVLQAVLPVLAFAPTKTTLSLTGGTHVNWSPTMDYTASVFSKIVSKMGFNVAISIERHGFYPAGAGKAVIATIPVRELKPIKLIERGNLNGVFGVSVAANLPEHVAKRQRTAAASVFPTANIRLEATQASCPGTAITLWAGYENGLLGASALGEKGKRAEDVGREAAEELLKEINSGACVDRHLADQLMVYAALAKGTSTFKTSVISDHVKTNAWLIEKIAGNKIVLNEEEKTITVHGMGV